MRVRVAVRCNALGFVWKDISDDDVIQPRGVQCERISSVGRIGVLLEVGLYGI